MEEETVVTPQPGEEFMSLFDYLGKPAGAQLGREVHAKAKEQKEKMKSKPVSMPNYTGKVMMYRKSFLDKYFHPTSTPTSSDDLPF